MNSDDNLNLESYKLFSNLLSHMPLIFYILDKDWNFLLSEGQGLEKLGLKPGEVVGRSARVMYQENTDIIREMESAYNGNIIKYDQVIGDFFLEDYIAPFYDKNGEIEGVFGASIDVTERKLSEIELEKTQALYEALRESIPGIIYIYNELGELIFWNKSHEIMTGYSKEELDHRSIMDWYKDDIISQQAVKIGLEDAQKNGYGEAETNLQCKDGSIKPIFATASPIKIEGKDCFVGIGVDISSRIEAENKLQELNSTLEEKVEQRTQELNEANQDLTSLNEELSIMNESLMAMNEEVQAMNEELANTNEKLVVMQEFLVESEKMAALGGLVAGVAHEVNTPLGIGLTAASHLSDISTDLLMQHQKGPLADKDIVSYLEDIEKASQIIFKNLNRAAHLIQSFKKLSVDQTTEPKRAFEIGSYIDEILLSLSPSLKMSRIKIITCYHEAITINGYPGSIAQLITNLVMNSLKHAYHPGDSGEIHIETMRHNAMVRIVFSDDGLGMDEKTLNKIYEPFFTTDRSSGGTGLGLAVVYSIVTQQYEGSINCSSKLGKGTTFIIDIKENPK